MNLARRVVVLVDANVLINFAHVCLIERLGDLSDLDFVVPENVVAEITKPEQRALVDKALEADLLRIERVEGGALDAFVGLTKDLGSGESACLAIAASTPDSMVASDERGLFHRVAVSLLGEGRILTTPDLLLRLIVGGHISVEDADAAKVTLETHRFRMRFGSFKERLPPRE